MNTIKVNHNPSHNRNFHFVSVSANIASYPEENKHENIPSSLHDFIIGNIQLEKQIGRGANGRILEAKWERITVAVKEIHSIFINEVSEPEFQTFKRSFLRECEQSNLLRHPNIVRFLGIYKPPGARVPSLVTDMIWSSSWSDFTVAGLLNQSARMKLTPSDRNKAVVVTIKRNGTERNGTEHLVPYNTYSTERLKNKLRQFSTLDMVFYCWPETDSRQYYSIRAA